MMGCGWPIVNRDPLPGAWLAAWRNRWWLCAGTLQGCPGSGLAVTVAGEDLPGVTPLAEGEGGLSKVLGFETVSTSHLVMASAFSFSPSHHQQGGRGAAPRWASRVAAPCLLQREGLVWCPGGPRYSMRNLDGFVEGLTVKARCGACGLSRSLMKVCHPPTEGQALPQGSA